MDDADLVHRARGGAREAWGEIYDRYADQLHDYCWTILRDRHEAEDALHDAFVAAARKLDQLRDPARLRPWLYAICRTQALARARRRSRAVPTEEVAEVSAPSSSNPSVAYTGAAGPDERAEQAELARLVQDAAGGLADRDRSVLALHLRGGLDGADLGQALGVDAHHANVLLSRVRDQVERSLGALLVARTGRRECPELDGILAGWDGGLTPLLRKRVARHIDRCDTCGERRRRVASPLALLAGAPVVMAPPSLRERVLDDVVRISSSSSSDPGAGDGGGASGRRRRALVAAAAAAALVLGGVAVLASGRGSPDEEVVASAGGTAATSSSPSTTTTAEGTTTLPPASSPTQPGAGPLPTSPASATLPSLPTSTTTAPATTAPPTSTAPPAAPVLVIDTPALDLGTTATSGQVRFTNSGGQGLAWTVASPLAALTASPASGVLPPGAQASVTVTLDRAAAPEGPLAVDLAVGGQGTVTGATAGPRTVPVRAQVDHVPVVTGLSTDRPRIVFASSTCGSTRATAAVSDESALTVVLSWRQAVGSTTELTMAALGDGRYGATIGPVSTPSGGNVTWWVTATDARGNRTRSADQTLPVATTC